MTCHSNRGKGECNNSNYAPIDPIKEHITASQCVLHQDSETGVIKLNAVIRNTINHTCVLTVTTCVGLKGLCASTVVTLCNGNRGFDLSRRITCVRGPVLMLRPFEPEK